MSWCGGGEMRPTPVVLWRVLAIHGYTFAPGRLPPSPGFAPCASLIWISSARDQVFAGDAEAGGGHLLDLGVALAVIALFRLAALAGVAPAAEAVQGDGDGLVGLAAQCAVAHGSGLEPLDDGADRLHLVQRDAAVGGIVEVQQAAQMDAVPGPCCPRCG